MCVYRRGKSVDYTGDFVVWFSMIRVVVVGIFSGRVLVRLRCDLQLSLEAIELGIGDYGGSTLLVVVAGFVNNSINRPILSSLMEFRCPVR